MSQLSTCSTCTPQVALDKFSPSPVCDQEQFTKDDFWENNIFDVDNGLISKNVQDRVKRSLRQKTPFTDLFERMGRFKMWSLDEDADFSDYFITRIEGNAVTPDFEVEKVINDPQGQYNIDTICEEPIRLDYARPDIETCCASMHHWMLRTDPICFDQLPYRFRGVQQFNNELLLMKASNKIYKEKFINIQQTYNALKAVVVADQRGLVIETYNKKQIPRNPDDTHVQPTATLTYALIIRAINDTLRPQGYFDEFQRSKMIVCDWKMFDHLRKDFETNYKEGGGCCSEYVPKLWVDDSMLTSIGELTVLVIEDFNRYCYENGKIVGHNNSETLPINPYLARDGILQRGGGIAEYNPEYLNAGISGVLIMQMDAVKWFFHPDLKINVGLNNFRKTYTKPATHFDGATSFYQCMDRQENLFGYFREHQVIGHSACFPELQMFIYSHTPRETLTPVISEIPCIPNMKEVFYFITCCSSTFLDHTLEVVSRNVIAVPLGKKLVITTNDGSVQIDATVTMTKDNGDGTFSYQLTTAPGPLGEDYSKLQGCKGCDQFNAFCYVPVNVVCQLPNCTCIDTPVPVEPVVCDLKCYVYDILEIASAPLEPVKIISSTGNDDIVFNPVLDLTVPADLALMESTLNTLLAENGSAEVTYDDQVPSARILIRDTVFEFTDITFGNDTVDQFVEVDCETLDPVV